MTLPPLNRRHFLTTATATLLLRRANAAPPINPFNLVATTDHDRILAAARLYLTQDPITVTASHSDRSAGGPHDYFSEGDYWWPDPKNPTGPYIRRDGFSNPANFNTHREALIRLSLIAPTLASAVRLTKGSEAKRYATHFTKHLRAWFVNADTKMNPNLEFAQAIFGVSKGRGIGIIDTLHLVEVVRAARVLEAAHALDPSDTAAIRTWFAAYVDWMATSSNGKDEEAAKNNHGTCWVLQAAEFAQFARRPDIVALCRTRFKQNLVPDQIAKDGTLPLELARTKPYSYSLFNADVFAGICQSLSTPAPAAIKTPAATSTPSSESDDLWHFKTPTSGSVADTIAWLAPWIADKSKWPYAKDVEYFDDLPARRPSLLFAGLALAHPGYIATWRHLDPDPTVPEVIRNMPIRQPLLWVDPILHP